MNGFFNPDNGFMRALSRLFDLMILNFLTLLLCIPVITAGASVAAMHSVMIQMVENREGYIIRTFFAKFKENFKQATLVWLFLLAVIVLLFMDFRIVSVMDQSMAGFMQTALIVLGLLVLFVGQYLFPLVARYENTFKGTMGTAVRLSVAFFPKTVAMLVVNAAVLFLLYKFFLQALPIFVMFCLTGPGYLCAQLYVPIFHKVEEMNGISQNAGEDGILAEEEAGSVIPPEKETADTVSAEEETAQ